MKKTVNKWLLLFASIFLMMTVACSNAAGGGSGSGDEKDKGKDTEQGTDDEPEIQSGEAPEIIEDDDYVGIKIKITAEIPKDAAVREIYVNGKQAGGNGFDTKDDGSISISKYVTATEWGYPFVTAGKKYEVFVKYLDKDYHGLKQTEKITITAKKGLGELKCPNAENKIEKNVLKFPKGSPRVYYGDNISVADYPNLADNSKPGYVLNIYGADWSYQTWNWLGEGKDFEYNQNFNFAKHLKEDADLTKEYMFNVVCSFTDKNYGDYTYFIAETTENKFNIDQDYLPKDSLDITQYFPSIDDLKGKVLAEAPLGTQYIEFASVTDSEGKLSGTMHACSIKTLGSSTQGTPTSYVWNTIPVSYMKGKLTTEKENLTLIKDNSNGTNLYCALFPAKRVSGEGIYGTFNFEYLGDLIVTLDKNGAYSIPEGVAGTYTFEDGIINFKDGFLEQHIAIYDGKKLYVDLYYYMEIAELPNPLPDPTDSSDPTTPATGIDETGAPYAKIPEVTLQNKDLKGKIFHFTNGKGSGKRDFFFEFATADSDTYGTLAVTMYLYGFDENDKYTEPYGQNAYTYNAGTLAAPASTSGTQATSYLIFYVNNKYYITADGAKFERDENSGTGLYCTFYTQIAVSESATQTITLSFNDNGDYSCNNGAKTVSGKYTNKNGVITLENKTEGNQYLLYDGEYLYSLVEFIQVGSLPTVSNASSGSGSSINWSNYSYLSGTYTATVTMTNTKTDENGQEIQETETSTDTLSVILDKKAFIWTREFDDGCLWFSGNLKIQKNQDTQADELILSCTKQAETSSFSEEPQDTDWQSVNADSYASFTKNTITIYAEDAIVTKTDAEGNILSSEKGEKVQLSNPIIFSKIEG